MPAARTRPATRSAGPAAARARETTTEPISASRTGSQVPRRSVNRPSSGLSRVSTAAVRKKSPPIAAPPQPRSCSFRGTRTLSTPKRREGSADAEDRPTTARQGRQGAERGAEQRPEDGGAHDRSDQRSAALRRACRDDPSERARPRKGAADALGKASQGERPGAAGEAEAETGRGGQRRADQHRALRADARGGDAAGHGSGEDSGRVHT